MSRSLHLEPLESRYLLTVDLSAVIAPLNTAATTQAVGISISPNGPAMVNGTSTGGTTGNVLNQAFALVNGNSAEQISSPENIGDINGDDTLDYLVRGTQNSYVLFGPLDLQGQVILQQTAAIVVPNSYGVPVQRMGDLNGVLTPSGTSITDLVYELYNPTTASYNLTTFVASPKEIWPATQFDPFTTPLLQEYSTTLSATGIGPNATFQLLNYNGTGWDDLLVTGATSTYLFSSSTLLSGPPSNPGTLNISSAVASFAGNFTTTILGDVNGDGLEDISFHDNNAGNIFIVYGGDSFATRHYVGGFDVSGTVTTAITAGSNFGNAMVLQPDGKTVVVGSASIAGQAAGIDIAAVRYNTDGTVDTSFGHIGQAILTSITTATGTYTFSIAKAVALQPNGDFVIAGQVTSGTNNYFAVLRLTPSGALDSTFGTGGLVVLAQNAIGNGVAIQTDGSIVVVGQTGTTGYGPDGFGDDNNSQLLAYRLHSNGTPDTSFGSVKNNGVLTGEYLDPTSGTGANAVVIQPDGNIVLAGWSLAGTLLSAAVFRLTAAGSTPGNLDASFGTNGVATANFGGTKSWATAVALQNNGQIAVASFVINPDAGAYNVGISRFNTGGTLDKSFGDGSVLINGSNDGSVLVPFPAGVSPNHSVHAIALQSDGKIVIAGNTTNPSNANEYDSLVARYNSNGTIDTSFGNNGIVTTYFGALSEDARGLAIAPDGKILVAGYSNNGTSGSYNFVAARYNTDGSLDDSQPNVFSLGDFNRHGYSDFALVQAATPGNQGQIQIYLGGDLPASLSSPALVIAPSPTSGIVFDQYTTITAGDWSGDGIIDLAIGNPSANSGAGSVYVLWGIGALLGLNQHPQTPPVVTISSANQLLTGVGGSDHLGSLSPTSLLSLNGDGVNDLVVGAPGAGVGGIDYVIYGTQPTPAVTIAGPALVLPYQTSTFTLSAGSLPADQAAGFTYTINWGDGSAVQTVSGLSGTQVTHTYTTLGTYSVNVTAQGDTSGKASQTYLKSVQVVPWLLSQDRTNPNQMDLLWKGGNGNNSVQFVQVGNFTVQINTLEYNGTAMNTTYIATGVTGQVIATGGGSNDTLDGSGLSSISATLDGAAGNNTLYGGGVNSQEILIGGSSGTAGQQGSNTIIGGDGNETIYGNSPTGAEGEVGGNNLIIGSSSPTAAQTIYGNFANSFSGNGGEGGRNVIVTGGGSDTVFASDTTDGAEGGQGSIIVSGITTLNRAALQSIRREWTSNDPLAIRLADIQGTNGTVGLNGSNYLIPGTTVFNSNAVDQLYSDTNGSPNWLFYSSASGAGSTLYLHNNNALDTLTSLNYSDFRIATVLHTQSGLTAQQIATLLTNSHFTPGQVADALNSAFYLGQPNADLEAALNLAIAGVSDGTVANGLGIAGALSFAFGDSPTRVATVLADINTDQIAAAIAGTFHLSDAQTAADLLTAGETTTSIAYALSNVYSDTAVQVATVLKGLTLDVNQVATALQSVFMQTDAELASTMLTAGYTATQVAGALQHVFGDGDSQVVSLFSALNVSPGQIAAALHGVFNDPISTVATFLNGLAENGAALSASTIAGALDTGFDLDTSQASLNQIAAALEGIGVDDPATIARALIDGLSLGDTQSFISEIANALQSIGLGSSAGGALRSIFSQSDAQLASIMLSQGYTVAQVAGVLKGVYGDSDTTATFILESLGINATGVAGALLNVYGDNGTQTDEALLDVQFYAPVVDGAFQAHLIAPSTVAAGNSTIYVQYINTGATAIQAPLLVLEATGSNQDISLSPALQTSSSSVQILAAGETAGMLQPGESEIIPIYLLNQNASQPASSFNFGIFDQNNSASINWSSQESSLQPATISTAAWSVIFGNLTAQLDNTMGSYVQALDNIAAYLGNLGENVTDATQLFQFAELQADGFAPANQLASVADLSLASPGLSLGFSRVYQEPIALRDTIGPLGYGWRDSWQYSLTASTGGTVTVTMPSGQQRIFQPNSIGGGYTDQSGDYGTLTAGTTGDYFLTETNGQVEHFSSDGTLDYVQDSNGNRITATYTSGQLTALTHSAGQSLAISYNAAGLIQSVTSSDGRVIDYSYDAGGHLTSVQGYDGRVTTYTYDPGSTAAANNALTAIAFADGTHRYFTYDSAGRLATTSQDGGANLYSYAYNLGEVTGTDAAGDATSYFFDANGLIVKTVDPMGAASTATFDNNFNVTSSTGPTGLKQLFNYDSHGNVSSSTNSLGQTTTFTYSATDNRLASATDAKGNTTTYAYNAQGDGIATTYADGSTKSATYDALGDPLSLVNQNGQVVHYTYNTAGLVISQTLADGSQTTFTYDSHGNLIKATNSSGLTILSYDAGDRLTQVTYPNGTLLKYTYDNAGRRIQMTNQTGYTVNYFYDTLGRLQHLTDGSGVTLISYVYDAAGRLSSETKANGTYTTYQYDADGRILHLINYAPNSAVDSRFDYTYNALGQQTSMTTVDGSWTYGYDLIGELTSATFLSTNLALPNQSLTYVYDAAGNRVQTIINGMTTSYSPNKLNEYTTVGGATNHYDADGNLLSTTDASGTTSYTYDSLNRLVSVTSPTDTWIYSYGALGDLVATTHNGQLTTNLVDPTGLGNVVATYNGSGAVTATYSYGLGLVSQNTSAGTNYFDFDALGSTADLTGPGGSVFNTYQYLPFGGTLGNTGSTSNPFTFVGQFGVSSDGSGLTNMRARMYAPSIGAFTSSDPLGIRQPTLYSYAFNNPISLFDATGLGPSYNQPVVPVNVGNNVVYKPTGDNGPSQPPISGDGIPANIGQQMAAIVAGGAEVGANLGVQIVGAIITGIQAWDGLLNGNTLPESDGNVPSFFNPSSPMPIGAPPDSVPQNINGLPLFPQLENNTVPDVDGSDDDEDVAGADSLNNEGWDDVYSNMIGAGVPQTNVCQAMQNAGALPQTVCDVLTGTGLPASTVSQILDGIGDLGLYAIESGGATGPGEDGPVASGDGGEGGESGGGGGDE